MTGPAPASAAAGGAPAAPEAPSPAQVPAQEPAKPEGGTDWKAEARKWESRAQANKAAADELEALKGANKSVEDRLAEVEGRAAAAEARALRREVALEHALTSEDAALLDGITDESTMRALAARLATQAAAALTGGNRAPNAGKTPPAAPDDPVRALARSIFHKN